MNIPSSHKRVEIFLIPQIILSVILAACGNIATPLPSTLTTGQSTQIFTVPSYIKYYSIQEISKKSTGIIIGKALQKGGILNTARDVKDLTKPAPNLFGVGQIYNFLVESVIKKDGIFEDLDTVLIVQHEGMTMVEEGASITSATIAEARAQEKYIPFLIDHEYILFLKVVSGYRELKMYGSGIGHPWRFLVYEGCVYPETPWDGAQYFFWPMPLEEFVEQVERALASDAPVPKPGWPLPTPPPPDPLCKPYPFEPEPLPLSHTPYPYP